MKKLIDICDIQYGYAFDSKCFTDDSCYPPLVRIFVDFAKKIDKSKVAVLKKLFTRRCSIL